MGNKTAVRRLVDLLMTVVLVLLMAYFLTGQEMHSVLESYYTVLFQAAPDSIGGGLPYDSFYYGVG